MGSSYEFGMRGVRIDLVIAAHEESPGFPTQAVLESGIAR